MGGIADKETVAFGPHLRGLRRTASMTLKQVAERAGLAHLDYGNRTIGARVDDFWLDGSLRVSAHEQIDFLERLYRNRLPFELAHQRLV